MMKAFPFCTLAAALAVLATGCNRDNVKVYHVENEDSITPPPVAAPAAPTANVDAGAMPAPAQATAPQLKYTLPDGWQVTAPSEMRVASFVVTNTAGIPADVGVIPMPTTGQEIQLVNMWRQQLQLAPTTGADADKISTNVMVGDSEGKLFDLVSETNLVDGTARARILVAMCAQGSTSWFFKMVGEESFVESQKPVFLQFLKSVSFGGLPAPSTMDLNQLPPGHPSLPGTVADNPTGATAAGNVPTWTTPDGWQTAPLSQFLLAKFSIPGAGGAQADVNVSALAGAGGGLLANVNRWQRQLGLDTVDQDGLAKLVSTFDANGNPASLVDFTGTDSKSGKPARLIGVMLPLGGQTWFYKLMGDPGIVAQQKDAFTKFIQSAKYPDVH
jgi:hypothetical protein